MFAAGTELESRKEFAQALVLYRQAAKIDDTYAVLPFRIARCHMALGDAAAGKVNSFPGTRSGCQDAESRRLVVNWTWKPRLARISENGTLAVNRHDSGSRRKWRCCHARDRTPEMVLNVVSRLSTIAATVAES